MAGFMCYWHPGARKIAIDVNVMRVDARPCVPAIRIGEGNKNDLTVRPLIRMLLKIDVQSFNYTWPAGFVSMKISKDHRHICASAKHKGPQGATLNRMAEDYGPLWNLSL